jgi:hypothetical protein
MPWKRRSAGGLHGFFIDTTHWCHRIAPYRTAVGESWQAIP